MAYLEPPGNDVYRYPTLRIVTDTSNLFRCYCRIPRARQERRNHIELFGKM